MHKQPSARPAIALDDDKEQTHGQSNKTYGSASTVEQSQTLAIVNDYNEDD